MGYHYRSCEAYHTMNKYKLIIFDFDGTLADTITWFSESINLAAEKYNFRKLTGEEMEELRGKETKEILSYLGISWWKIPFIASYMRQLMAEKISSIYLFDRVELLLNQLSDKNYKLAVVSSNSLHNVSQVLGPKNMALIDHIECGASVFGKDSKYKKILAKTKFAPHEVLSLGDETRDIEAARKVRIHSGAVTWGYAKGEVLRNAKANYTFENMDELMEMLF